MFYVEFNVNVILKNKRNLLKLFKYILALYLILQTKLKNDI